MQRFKKLVIFLICATALTTLAESRAPERGPVPETTLAQRH